LIGLAIIPALSLALEPLAVEAVRDLVERPGLGQHRGRLVEPCQEANTRVGFHERLRLLSGNCFVSFISPSVFPLNQRELDGVCPSTYIGASYTEVERPGWQTAISKFWQGG
jgi:hypothetical protein